MLLRAGALPADLTIVEERTVGPSLGADSIDAGKFASLIAGVLVVGFMLVAYGTLGLIANLALAANVALIIAILSVLGATLTMPGIAGIVLTIGMAVDSNVIIYERVREERRSGRSLVQSLDSGFSRALATIVDANFTTFIAGDHPLLPRLRPGARLRRDAGHRHRHHRVHRLHADPLADRDLAEAHAARRSCRTG